MNKRLTSKLNQMADIGQQNHIDVQQCLQILENNRFQIKKTILTNPLHKFPRCPVLLGRIVGATSMIFRLSCISRPFDFWRISRRHLMHYFFLCKPFLKCMANIIVATIRSNPFEYVPVDTKKCSNSLIEQILQFLYHFSHFSSFFTL